MKGNFFLGGGNFEVRDMQLGHPGAGQVLIRNMAAGICGTDVHIMRGEKGSADVTPPVVLGHEYAGEVVEVGEGVTTCRPGDHVTVDPNIYCGRCRFCRNGQKQFCENLVAVGVNFDGGFAQYSLVPQTQVFPLGPDVSWEAGAMAEPLACCRRLGAGRGRRRDRPADGSAGPPAGRGDRIGQRALRPQTRDRMRRGRGGCV